MPTTVRLGRDSVFYLNTGTFGSPTWAAVPQFSDLNVTAEWDETEASTRESKMKMKAKTLLGAEVGGKLKPDLTDTNIGTILDALLSDAVVDVMVLNAASSVNGARGYRYECQVHSGNEDQGLGVAIFDDIKFKPFPTANAKQTAKVASGAPVFTAI